MRTLTPLRISFHLSTNPGLCTHHRGHKRLLGARFHYRNNSSSHIRASANNSANTSTMSNASSNGKSPSLLREREAAIQAVAAAHVLTRTQQKSIESGLGTLKKVDNSPVTVADFATQAYVVSRLAKQFPEDRFIAEESTKLLREDNDLLDKVVSTANIAAEFAGTEPLTRNSVLDAIDLCTYKGGDGLRTWILDPIDGTIGYQNGRQYCIALGLICDGVPSLGVLGCPSLEYDGVRGSAKSGVLFYATTGSGAWMQRESSINSNSNEAAVRVRASKEQDPTQAVVMTSVEVSHSRRAVSDSVASLLGMRLAPLRMDSQAKYGALSRGDAHVFLRMPHSSYEEFVWDHAAGVVVLTEAGGKITDGRGRPLDFSKGRTLDNLDGIVATNGGTLHDAVISAVQRSLAELAS